jgi:hypothetical protein
VFANKCQPYSIPAEEKREEKGEEEGEGSERRASKVGKK